MRMKPVHCPNCRRRLIDVAKGRNYEVRDLENPRVAEPDREWRSDIEEKCPQCRHLIGIRYVRME
ncbi:MAG: hypothetical protein MJ041_06000 [Acidaminococcaceae bacterium]|nr:hypothetical protein [Acidaminococcaceae bacterium]